MVDYKSKIIEELEVVLQKCKNNGDTFKIRAYDKVIKQIKVLDKITNYDDLKEIEGIGSGIEKKIKEILATGTLEIAEKIKEEPSFNIYNSLMKIHGIGSVKAKNLISKYKIDTIDKLRELSEKDSKILNRQQKIGLKYYEELQERIPREEMVKHEKKIVKISKEYNLNAIVVGSYRRGLKDSGDIDILLTGEDDTKFKEFVEKLIEIKYITDILALGDKKCMAVCKIDEKARRLDLLLTPKEEYATSILYFTGSDKFNIGMRKIALDKGYSLSEHGIKVISDKKEEIPVFNSEEEIFDFLGMKYVKPNKR